jgi:hypothetical protein
MRILLKNTSLPDLSRDSNSLFLQILEKVADLSVLMETAEWLDFIPPDLAQMRTYTHRPHSHPHPSGRTCINGTLQLPDGALNAIRDKAISMFAELVEDDDKFSERKELLIRLASDSAWYELCKHKRVGYKSTEEFVYHPCFVNIGYAYTVRLTVAEVRQQLHDSIEKIPEEEIQEFIYQLSKRVLLPWPKAPTDPVARQDLAVRYLFHHAYLTYLAGAPVLTTEEIISHFHEYEATVQTLREQAEKLASFGLKRHAEELRRIAFDCSSRNTDALDNRWLVDRKRGSNRLRAYVITLAELNKRLFGAPLYSTLASIANAAFELKNTARLDAARVREMLRGGELAMAGRNNRRRFTPWDYSTGKQT